MRRLAVVAGIGVTLGVLGSGPVSAANKPAEGPALDGTRWSVTVTPDEAAAKKGEKPSKDTLIFKGGKFTSTACGKYGFETSSYTASPSGTTESFTSEQMSKKQGKIDWNGSTAGESINGTMTWAKKDGSVLRYTFEGKKSAKRKAS